MDRAEGFFLECSSAHQGFWKALPGIRSSQKVRFLGLTYEDLSKQFQETGGGEDFQKAQKEKASTASLCGRTRKGAQSLRLVVDLLASVRAGREIRAWGSSRSLMHKILPGFLVK